MISFSLILLVVQDGWSPISSPSLAFWINWLSSSVCPASHCIPWPMKKAISSNSWRDLNVFLIDIRRNLDSPSWIWHWNIPGMGLVPGIHRANPLLLAPPNAISTPSHMHCVPPSKCAPFSPLPWIICTAKIASHDKILRKRDIFYQSADCYLGGRDDIVLAMLAMTGKEPQHPPTQKTLYFACAWRCVDASLTPSCRASDLKCWFLFRRTNSQSQFFCGLRSGCWTV